MRGRWVSNDLKEWLTLGLAGGSICEREHDTPYSYEPGMRLFGRATRTLQLLKTVTNTTDARHYAGKTPQTPGGGRADVAPPNHTEPPHSVAGVGGAVKLCDSRRLNSHMEQRTNRWARWG